jgi:hypothetical protein
MQVEIDRKVVQASDDPPEKRHKLSGGIQQAFDNPPEKQDSLQLLPKVTHLHTKLQLSQLLYHLAPHR